MEGRNERTPLPCSAAGTWRGARSKTLVLRAKLWESFGFPALLLDAELPSAGSGAMPRHWATAEKRRRTAALQRYWNGPREPDGFSREFNFE
ncbi:MAG: hypothetical protein DME25_00760 [Verrucomicrobia bacterium]|nr:MAG: hypothetical protein DME25_00760 [Verrucomicrobiota bacterium]